MESLGSELPKINRLINQSTVIEAGTPTRYRLKPKTDCHDKSEHYRKLTFGERDTNKPHKTILMVGETGMGKTTLINVMINYMLDIKIKDKVWFEISDDRSDRTSDEKSEQYQAHSQTSIITLYEFYLQESQMDLTIIDTPGYGDTHGVDPDKEISKCLLRLSQSADGIHEIDAVCLVIKAMQNRLYDSQKYIFHAVQSLFGKNIAENLVLLLTNSRGAIPKNVLKAAEEVKLKCAVDKENQPVFFLFDNCQGETYDEVHKEPVEMLQQSWSLSFKGMSKFYNFLDAIKPKPLQMTEKVLQKRKELEENILKIKSHDKEMDLKKNELKQIKEALKQNIECLNFENEVEVTYNEKIDMGHILEKLIVSCNKCEKSCHSEVKSSWYSIFSSGAKNDVCTVCQCNYRKHIKGSHVFVQIKRMEKKVNEDLKKKYDEKIRDGESSIKKLKEELQELEKEKIKQVFDAFYCVETLQKITLNSDSLLTFLYVDFLIEKLREINEFKKAKTLENLKGEERKEKMECKKRCVESENYESAL